MSENELEEELVKIHGLLCKIALFKLKNKNDAEDAVAETEYLAFKNIDKLEDKEKFKYWILSILNRECIKFYKRSEDDDLLIEKIKPFTSEEYEDYSLEKLESKENFEDLIKDLTEEEKEVIRPYVLSESTISKISNDLDENLNTVKSRFRRAKEKLKTNKKLNKFIPIILILIIFSSGIAIAGTIITNKIRENRNYEVHYNSEQIENVEYNIENNELTLKIDFCESKINKNDFEPYLNDKFIYLTNINENKKVIYPTEANWLQDDIFEIKFNCNKIKLAEEASVHILTSKGESVTILLKN